MVKLKLSNRKKSKFISIDASKCEAWWNCIGVCPNQVIGKVKFLWHKHVIIRDAENCIECESAFAPVLVNHLSK